MVKNRFIYMSHLGIAKLAFFMISLSTKTAMRHISTVFTTLFVSLLSISCAGDKKASSISVDELAMTIEDMQDGDTLTVRGYCTYVCTSGASHLTLAGEDDTNMIAAHASKDIEAFDASLQDRYVTVTSILHEQKVDRAFLDDWEFRLDESLKGPNGNPPAVAQLKLQIKELRDSIDARYARCGKEYWSNYTLEVISYEAE